MYLQKRLLAILTDVHGLGSGGVRAVVGRRIKALFTGFQLIARIAAVEALFLTADCVGAFPIRRNRGEGTGVICCPA